MTAQHTRRLLLCALIAFAPLACDKPIDDDDDIDECVDETGVGPGSIDQCQNDVDLTWLEQDFPDPKTDGLRSGRELARAEAGNCGLRCLNHECPDMCAIACMAREGVELSAGCSGCYGRIVLCTIGNCLPQCINDPQAEACKECQEDKGCNDDFYDCTGPLPE